MGDELQSKSWPTQSSSRRSLPRPCHRCGLVVGANRLAALGGIELCPACWSADRARYLGLSSGNYSPFRTLAVAN